MDPSSTIGQRIRTVRAELSQKAFGARIGLSQTAVTALENDLSEPRLGTFNAIVEAFRVSPEWLRTGHGAMKPAALEAPAAALAIPAGPVAAPAPPVAGPAADVVAQFLALLAEREAALEKKHRLALQSLARKQQWEDERALHQTARLETELDYLRGLLGHRPPTADELALQQQAAAAAKGKPAGFKNYDEQPAPQAVEMTLSRGETAFPRPPEPVAAAPCPLRCAA